ncbi:hypothetical protein [Viscerimonas tarda]
MRKYINIVFLVASVCFSIQAQGNTVFVQHLKAEPTIHFSKSEKQIFGFDAYEILNKDANLPSFIHRKLGANNDWFEWKLERTDGKIKITGSHKTKERYNSLTTKVLDPITLDADAMLVLHFDSPLTYGLETVQKSGSAIVIPALSFWSILEEKYERDLRPGLKVGAMIITLPAAAEGGWAGAFVLIDELALGSTILIDDTGWREAIKSDEGKLLLQAYDVLITAYFTGRALEAVGAFNGLKASYSNWQKVTVEAKEAEAITARMSRIAKIEDDADGWVVRLIEPGDAGADGLASTVSVGRKLSYRPSWKPDLVIEANPNKTTTIIGKWSEEDLGLGTNKIIKELESEGNTHFNVYSKKGKPSNNGGFNLLNENLPNMSNNEIWTNYNEPWIREALTRGDDIYLISNPINQDGFYKLELDYIKNHIKNNPTCGYSFEEGLTTGKLIQKGGNK